MNATKDTLTETLVVQARSRGGGGSLGAARVRESFNPGKHELVDKIKRYTADLIDLCHVQQDKHDDPEEGRLWSLAMTHYEDAAMWAVKAATTNKP